MFHGHKFRIKHFIFVFYCIYFFYQSTYCVNRFNIRFYTWLLFINNFICLINSMYLNYIILTTFSPLFCLIDNNKQGCSFIKYGCAYSHKVPPWLDVWSISDILLLKPSKVNIMKHFKLYFWLLIKKKIYFDVLFLLIS